MRGLFSQDDQLSSRELTEISCGLTILSFTVLILLYTFVVLCCTFYERNLRCGRTLGIHLPTGSPRYTTFGQKCVVLGHYLIHSGQEGVSVLWLCVGKRDFHGCIRRRLCSWDSFRKPVDPS